MRPAKSAQGEEQGELYQRRLSTLLDQRHPLYVLAEALDWEFFEREFGALYVEQRGRPGLPMRLLVGPRTIRAPSTSRRRQRTEELIRLPSAMSCGSRCRRCAN